MYYQNYEDYMRSVLGYPAVQSQNTCQYSPMPYEAENQFYSGPVRYSDDVMDLYPDIYKLVNPMVCKICETNNKPITKELIDQMTDEIYSNIEVEEEPSSTQNNRASEDKNSKTTSLPVQNRATKSSRVDSQKQDIKEVREDRQRRPGNNSLRDLIRILILNQLLGGNSPNRPPRPPRPPFPPNRPPYPRDDIYRF